MGHIINALAFRLGWSVNWSDSWYTHYLYYSEYLFSILRMRFFLIYFFSFSIFVDRGFLYSHFDIYSKRDVICVNIFYYDYNLKNSFNKLLSVFSNVVRDYNQSNKKIKFRYIKFWRIFVFLTYSLNFFFRLKNFLVYYRLLFFIFSFKKFSFDRLFSKSKYVFNRLESFSLSRRISFVMVFVTLVRKVLTLIKLGQKRKSSSLNALYSRFFFSVSFFHWNYDLFSHLKIFFSYFFYLFTSFNNFNVNFYLLSNYSLNAAFLSRYVVRQLRFGNDVREIMATLRIELRQVRFRSKEKFSSSNVDRLYSKVLVNNLNNKYSFNNFVSNLFYFASRQFWCYFKLSCSWLLMDSLLVYRWIYLHGSTLYFFINFSVIYNSNIFSLNFFFGKNFLKDLNRSLINFNSWDNFSSLCYYNFLINVSFVINYLFANFSFALFNKEVNYIKLDFFKLINLSLNRFVSLSYYNYSKVRNWPLSGLNFKFIRRLKALASAGLYGFKVCCLGRFSRRQRARKLYFSDFQLPLTKVYAKIDYSFIATPLDNSAVSVKIWLYKNSKQPNFYLKGI